jgi:hypothetical protein
MTEPVATHPGAGRRPLIHKSIAGMLIGAVVMVVVVHPALELLHLWRMNSSEGLSIPEMASTALQSAFTGSMEGMTLSLALIGAFTGLMVALLVRGRGKVDPHLTVPGDEQSLRRLIDTGESDHLEFKSSMRWDGKQGKVNKALEYVIAKTLCGLMNHRGGILMIGVDDQGHILGIGKDCGTLRQQNEDGFEQRLVTLATTYLGGRHARGIQTRFVFCEGLHRLRKSRAPLVTQNLPTRFFEVCDVAADLDREDEIIRHAPGPLPDRAELLGSASEHGVATDLDAFRGSCHGDLVFEVNVLDGVKHFDALVFRTLEDLAARDEAAAAGALVDDGGADGMAEVIVGGGAA